MDALFFEEYYCYSHDYLNTGVGFSLISTYLTFPFLPTLITTYLLDRSPLVAWYYLVLIGIMNAVGYVIFRYTLELQMINPQCFRNHGEGPHYGLLLVESATISEIFLFLLFLLTSKIFQI